MASRYENNETYKTDDNRTVYNTRIYPNIPKKNSDIYVVSQTGDRLDSLANQFYSNSSLLWIIATANNIHDASLSVTDGTVLRIPIDHNEIINNFRNK